MHFKERWEVFFFSWNWLSSFQKKMEGCERASSYLWHGLVLFLITSIVLCVPCFSLSNVNRQYRDQMGGDVAIRAEKLACDIDSLQVKAVPRHFEAIGNGKEKLKVMSVMMERTNNPWVRLYLEIERQFIKHKMVSQGINELQRRDRRTETTGVFLTFRYEISINTNKS